MCEAAGLKCQNIKSIQIPIKHNFHGAEVLWGAGQTGHRRKSLSRRAAEITMLMSLIRWRVEQQGELIKIMWCYRIKTSLPITEEALKPVTPPKGIYLIHICSQFYVIYTNYFKSIFLSISGFLFHHFPDFSLLCCSFTVNSWQWKKKNKFLITFWQA